MAVTISTDIRNGQMSVPPDMREDLETKTEMYFDPRSSVVPDEDRISETIEAYLDSDAKRNPMIIVGRGATKEGNRQSIEDLAERVGAVLGTAFSGRSYFPIHPYCVGTIGETGQNLAMEYRD